MRNSRGVVVLAVLLLIVSAQIMWAQKAKVWDLGIYPGGTWAGLNCINDSGVAVGGGDVAGDQRMIGVRLFGPNAGDWFESGVSSNGSVVQELMPAISNTGLIAGTIVGANGHAEAYAWIQDHAGFHLGALPGDHASYAYAINGTGTFIVGQSFGERQGTIIGTAVVWTAKVNFAHGEPNLAWEIHALPTGGLEEPGVVFEGVTLRLWGGWGVNDSGQIAGDAYEYNADTGEWWEIAVVWNPIKHGTEWEMQRLPMVADPMAADFPYTEALAINNLGEIVGDVWGSAAAPALWKPEGNTWKLAVLPTFNPDPMWDVATSINEAGDVVGYCFDSGWVQYATRWDAHAPLSPAQTLGFPGDWSAASCVNNSGVAVGAYGVGDVQRAYAVKFR